ncbi:MAG: hypothetical protein WB679_02320 [Terracidiphilus sp.]
MIQRAYRSLLLMAFVGGCFTGLLPAQNGRVITIKVRDGKTGASVTPSNIHVRFNHQGEASGNWVDQKDDGTIEVRLPVDAKAITVRATYENSMEYFVNCDMAKQKDSTADSWYPVSDILTAGIAIPNDCVRPKDADKVKADAKPGEFVLFVRKRNWKEEAKEY